MNEYISRKAVYQFAKDHKEKETGAFSKGYNKGLRVMMAAAMDVGAIPSADVRPVGKGRWEGRKTFFHNSIVKCSLCGNFLDLAGVNAGRGDANFCPNCGADMRSRPKEGSL